MIDSLPGLTTPEGSRLSLYSTSPMTSVWPALCPPWNRTTTSARLDSQSTILPLPSSPHWTPTTTTFAIVFFLLGRNQTAAKLAQRLRVVRPRSQQITAIQPPRLGLGVCSRLEPHDRDPTRLPQTLGVPRPAFDRNINAVRRDAGGRGGDD